MVPSVMLNRFDVRSDIQNYEIKNFKTILVFKVAQEKIGILKKVTTHALS